MKNIILALVLLSFTQKVSHPHTVDFMFDAQPAAKLKSLIGQNISVSGYIRKTQFLANCRLWTIGKIGDPIDHSMKPPELLVEIRKIDLQKFDDIKDIDLPKSFVFLQGRLIETNHKLRLILSNRKGFKITKWNNNSPDIR